MQYLELAGHIEQSRLGAGQADELDGAGAPPGSLPNGTDIAGQPVRFHGGVIGE